MSTRTRLTATFTALFSVIIIALAIGAYVLFRSSEYAKLDAALTVAGGATAMSAEHELNEHATASAGENDLRSVLGETESSDLTDTQILVREQGRIVAYRPTPLAHVMDLRAIEADLLKNGATVAGLRVAARSLQIAKFHTVYQIYSAKPIGPTVAQLNGILIDLLVLVPFGLALAGLSGYLLAARSLRPLQHLAQTIDSVTSSDLTARVNTAHLAEDLAKLGSRFNSLLDRLQDAFNSERRFMTDASHQIRTPVTVALTASQVTGRDPDATVADCKESLQIIERQMLQLRRTIDDMFLLSQADASSLKLSRKEMYLGDAVTEAVRAARTLINAKGQNLRCSDVAEARCLGDEDLLKQAILILLDNAVKFTPPGGDIEVVLVRRGTSWICSVTDSGIGIPEAAQPRVFERFFQEGRPAGEASSGAGLGLPIAKAIVENHGGTLKLVESRPGKTRFELGIPALEPESQSDADHANSLAVRI